MPGINDSADFNVVSFRMSRPIFLKAKMAAVARGITVQGFIGQAIATELEKSHKELGKLQVGLTTNEKDEVDRLVKLSQEKDVR